MIFSALFCVSGVTAFVFSDGSSLQVSTAVDMNNQTLRGLKSPVGGDEAATRDWVLANAPSGGCCKPYTVPPIEPAQSDFVCPSTQLSAGLEIKCEIFARASNNIRAGLGAEESGAFDVDVVQGDGSHSVRLPVVFNETLQRYHFTVSPLVTGSSGSISVKYMNVHLAGSPVAISIVPGPLAALTLGCAEGRCEVVTQDALGNAAGVLGDAILFDVVATHQNGTDFPIGPVIFEAAGLFSFSLVDLDVGNYTFVVQYGSLQDTLVYEITYVCPFSTTSWTSLDDYPSLIGYTKAFRFPDGRIGSLGGHDGTNPLATSYALDPITGVWSSLASMPEATYNGAMGVLDVGGSLIAHYAGGSTPAKVKLFRFDLTSETWLANGPNMPSDQEYQGGAVMGNELYSIAGSGSGGYYNKVHRFNPTTNSWSTIASYPVACNGIACAGDDATSSVICAGGYASTANTAQSHRYQAGAWSALGSLPSPMRGSTLVFVKGVPTVLFGFTTTHTTSFLQYDGSVWVDAGSTPYASHYQSAIVAGFKDDVLVVFGGNDGSPRTRATRVKCIA